MKERLSVFDLQEALSSDRYYSSSQSAAVACMIREFQNFVFKNHIDFTLPPEARQTPETELLHYWIGLKGLKARRPSDAESIDVSGQSYPEMCSNYLEIHQDEFLKFLRNNNLPLPSFWFPDYPDSTESVVDRDLIIVEKAFEESIRLEDIKQKREEFRNSTSSRTEALIERDRIVGELDAEEEEIKSWLRQENRHEELPVKKTSGGALTNWVQGKELLDPPYGMARTEIFELVEQGRLVPYTKAKSSFYVIYEYPGMARVFPTYEQEQLYSRLTNSRFQRQWAEAWLARTDDENRARDAEEKRQSDAYYEKRGESTRVILEDVGVKRLRLTREAAEMKNKIATLQDELASEKAWIGFDFSAERQSELKEKILSSWFRKEEFKIIQQGAGDSFFRAEELIQRWQVQSENLVALDENWSLSPIFDKTSFDKELLTAIMRKNKIRRAALLGPLVPGTPEYTEFLKEQKLLHSKYRKCDVETFERILAKRGMNVAEYALALAKRRRSAFGTKEVENLSATEPLAGINERKSFITKADYRTGQWEKAIPIAEVLYENNKTITLKMIKDDKAFKACFTNGIPSDDRIRRKLNQAGIKLASGKR